MPCMCMCMSCTRVRTSPLRDQPFACKSPRSIAMRRRAMPTLTWSVSCCVARPIQLSRVFCNRGLHSRALSTIADPPARVDARVGVFVDVENLGSFLKADGARRLVEWSTEYGKVVMRKAVGNFSKPRGQCSPEEPHRERLRTAARRTACLRQVNGGCQVGRGGHGHAHAPRRHCLGHR